MLRWTQVYKRMPEGLVTFPYRRREMRIRGNGPFFGMLLNEKF